MIDVVRLPTLPAPDDRSPILGNVGLSVTFAWVFLILLALAFGSFLNVCIARLPRHRSVIHPRSSCPRCAAPIAALDNIPLISWLALRGRCRACGLPISPRYPLVELAYAALVAACIGRFGFGLAAASASVFCFLCLGLLVMDLETMLLPDAFTLPGVVLGLVSATALAAHPLALSVLGARTLSAVISALAALALRWAYYAIRRTHGLGAGDVKLIAMLAAWLGNANMAVAFFTSVMLAALVGVGLIARSSRSNARSRGEVSWRRQQLPFGAFLCGGGLYALFFGPQTLKWYLSFWP